MFKDKVFRTFAIAAFFYCLLCAAIFKPITWQAKGDAGAYIELSKQFLGISNEFKDFSNRQPLYSFLIAPFILVFGEDTFLYPVMWLQFLIIFLSALIVYALFKKLNLFKFLPVLSGSAYLLNLSTLFYGYNILSETLALFIFVSIVYVLLLLEDNSKTHLLMVLGLLNGLMVLARYNTMGIPLITMICLLLIHFRNHGAKNHKLLMKSVFCYGISVIFILNLWMLYNYYQRGFYGIIQKDHPRFNYVTNSCINENIKVSIENQPILDIFLKAREEILNKQDKIIIKKGSLLEYHFFYDLYFFFKGNNIVRGNKLFGLVRPKLLTYFGLENNSKGISEIGKKLAPFYREIKSQTRGQEMKSRFSALLQTFRASGTTLPVKQAINLNALPGWIFVIYKMIFIFINTFVFVFSFFLVVSTFWRIRSYKNWLLLLVMITILYFPASHFIAITPGDANRFKFPAEPLINGLFIYYACKLVYWIFSHRKKIST